MLVFNRLLMVIHWGIFIGAIVCFVPALEPLISNITTPVPTCKQVANPMWDGKTHKKGSDKVLLQILDGKARTISKCSGPHPPRWYKGMDWIVGGLLALMAFSILLFIIKGRWIWFPWKHNKD